MDMISTTWEITYQMIYSSTVAHGMHLWSASIKSLIFMIL